MRFLLIAAALCLSACGPHNETAADGCGIEETHDVTWSDADAPDVVSVRAEGPACDQAVAIFTLRNADGDALWAFASTFNDLTIGGPPPEGAPPVSRASVEEFLASWARVTEMRSGALPEWRADQTHPGAGVESFGYETPFDRETYEMMRQRDVPTICYAVAVAAVQCLIMDPASHAPAVIVHYGS